MTDQEIEILNDIICFNKNCRKINSVFEDKFPFNLRYKKTENIDCYGKIKCLYCNSDIYIHKD
jgi:hypothetical protein